MRSALEPGTLRDDVAKRKHNVIFRPIIHDFFEKKKIARGEYMIGRLFNNMSAFGSFRFSARKYLQITRHGIGIFQAREFLL